MIKPSSDNKNNVTWEFLKPGNNNKHRRATNNLYMLISANDSQPR